MSAIRLAAWVGSRDLDAAIAPVGCGCDLAVRAVRDPNPDARAMYAADAPAIQARWRCPCAGHVAADDAGELDAGCREALACAERVADVHGLATCPLSYTRTPFVQRVVRARRWAERGCLELVEPAPAAVLIAAIDELDTALYERERADLEHAKADSAKANAPPPPPLPRPEP